MARGVAGPNTRGVNFGKGVSFNVRGPILAGRGPRSAASIVEIEMTHAILEVSEEGLQLVRQQLFFGHGMLSGELRNKSIKIRGRSKRMRRIAPAPRHMGRARTLEGIGKRNRVFGIKGLHMFRNAAERLGTSADPIAKKHAAHLARELGGP
jgi:hypothetical protein